jgi:hypothetical protein
MCAKCGNTFYLWVDGEFARYFLWDLVSSTVNMKELCLLSETTRFD